MTTYDFDFLFPHSKYVFNRPVHEVRGVQIVEKDEKYLVRIHALGMNKDDINIQVEDAYGRNGYSQIVRVSGETKDETFGDCSIGTELYSYKNIVSWEATLDRGYLVIEFTFEDKKPLVKGAWKN